MVRKLFYFFVEVGGNSQQTSNCLHLGRARRAVLGGQAVCEVGVVLVAHGAAAQGDCEIKNFNFVRISYF